MEANLTVPELVPEHLSDAGILVALEAVPKEAADIVNIPIGTVMSRLSRGRKLLPEQLREVARSYGIGMANGGEA